MCRDGGPARLTSWRHTIDPFITALLGWIIVFAGTAGLLARARDRRMAFWMVFGALLGPVALVLLWVAPPGRCTTCGASVRGWMTTCEWCGNRVAGRPRTPVDPRPRGSSTVKTRPAPATPAKGRNSIVLQPTAIIRSGDAATDARIELRLTSMKRKRADAGAGGSAPTGEPEQPSVHPDPSTTEPPPPARLTAVASPPTPLARRTLATGVYVTGTIPLVAGSRYALEVGGPSLRILGPVDIDGTAIALTQDLAGIEATGFDERLVVTFGGGGRHGMVLVFASIEGASAAAAADGIVSAARAARVAS